MSDNNIIKKVRSLMSSNKKDEEVKMGKEQLISELEEEMRVLKMKRQCRKLMILLKTRRWPSMKFLRYPRI